MAGDDEVLLRQPFCVICDSLQEARNLHDAFPKITTLAGRTVSFSRSIRIREAWSFIKAARARK